ncbi:hypothetical protein GCM10011371_04560 [Novosphingobium marinum]|uniref:Uncharacterized protein n=1 Tax=Novosphingobium marinum TaxID=1514948 RepID=A0A7Z0BRT6_9SPHN|nr:hypothetical protein [Novosphingobium marinum]NYH94146.1 hypothetical protein [Novosphingobium marinum]GGC19944.1 hypothetical protein GCM10011371_04560 [Novosphingobium marinum]
MEQDNRDPRGGSSFSRDAREELAGMLQDGFDHPSTKPVLAWGAMGAVAAAILPVVGVPLGFAAGAGYKFYKRIRPD